MNLNHLFANEKGPLASLQVIGKENILPYKWAIKFVSIPEWQGQTLIALANAEDRTVANIIREALSEYLTKKLQSQV